MRNSSIRDSVKSQLGLCAAAVAGTAAIGAEADGALVLTNANTSIPVPQTTAGVYLNLITGATGTSGASVSGWDFNPYNTASGLGFYWSGTLIAGQRSGGVETAVGSALYADLTAGGTVGPASTFTSAIQGTSANFRSSGDKVLGLRFVNENTGVFNYGYLTITTTGNSGFPATITGWVYDDAGASVTYPIPEPSAGLLLLTAGAAAMRRRRGQVA